MGRDRGLRESDDTALMKSVILKKTISVAAREGLRSYSVKSVANECGCSDGLIFHYFSTKKELTDMCYRYIVDEFSKKAVSEKKDLPSLLRCYCDFMKENREMALFSLEYIEKDDGDVGLDIIADAVRDSYVDEGEDFCKSITRSIAIFGSLIGSGKLKWSQFSDGKYKTTIDDIVGWMVSGASDDDIHPPPV